MRRAETILFSAVVCFAAFVVIQITHAPHEVPSPAQQGMPASPIAPATAAATAPVQSATPTTQDVTAAAQSAPQPAADLANTRARIAAAKDAYLSDFLPDQDSVLLRWPDRRETGLRVWVQTTSAVADWNLRYAQMARDVFDEWATAGVPLRLDYVLDSASADVRIVWIERFPATMGRRIGLTTRTNERTGWLVGAQISVALHDSAGRTLQPEQLTGVVRHEAGHALGLGHSRDRNTIMYPTETSTAISDADRATLRLLYQLPPGSLKG